MPKQLPAIFTRVNFFRPSLIIRFFLLYLRASGEAARLTQPGYLEAKTGLEALLQHGQIARIHNPPKTELNMLYTVVI